MAPLKTRARPPRTEKGKNKEEIRRESRDKAFKIKKQKNCKVYQTSVPKTS